MKKFFEEPTIDVIEIEKEIFLDDSNTGGNMGEPDWEED